MTTAITKGPGASAEAIRRHYDAGDEFYALWLDPTLTYSGALWDESDTLESAQLRKLDFHAAQSGARGAARALDVGCGWGSLLRRLVETHGVGHAVGLTLSRNQARYVAALGDPRMEVRLESWLDHAPELPYDAIVSIGAFEHFARPDVPDAEKVKAYRAFFERCRGWLVPGGRLSLQTIVYGSSGREDFSEFFAREIFPESDLPRVSEIAQAADRLFEIVLLRNDREHYVRTLRAWRARLRARRAEAERLVGVETVDRYDRYLQYAMIGLHTGTMGLARVSLRRIDRRSGPA